ncbi:MAG TPA: hypothetical protein VKB62_14985 [Streptosporangiaceae bacterium]|nr:hypothetical protein [Streptosporangiaceae bacterium]
MSWLCLRALVCRAVRIAYGGSPACERALLIFASTLATAPLTLDPGPDGAGVDGVATAVRRGRGRPGAAVRVGADFSRAGRLDARDTAVGELLETAWQAADVPAGHDAMDRSAAFAAA